MSRASTAKNRPLRPWPRSHRRSLGRERDNSRILGRIGPVGELAETRNVGRLPEQVALRFVAKLAFKKREFGGRFYSLRKDRKTQRPPEAKHRAHNRGRLIIDVDRLDEGAIDLDLVERKGAQV